ncbi:hypothetical protein FNAPI_3318 [Fusarium napiforme]|uniref:Uncharacterized protein n=1 Tax=Fusarium napiforme TaxID=42672 RepID=A0A8H5JZF1_9HYPO|nr:hypothetical protein FNAPI_3318 [Fusarium napiforme]
MAPNNKNNKNDQLELLGAVSKGSIGLNSQRQALPRNEVNLWWLNKAQSQRSVRRVAPPGTSTTPNVVMKTSTQCGFPFPYTSERVNTVEEGLDKRLEKLESVAINTKFTALEQRLSATEKNADVVVAAAATEKKVETMWL